MAGAARPRAGRPPHSRENGLQAALESLRAALVAALLRNPRQDGAAPVTLFHCVFYEVDQTTNELEACALSTTAPPIRDRYLSYRLSGFHGELALAAANDRPLVIDDILASPAAHCLPFDALIDRRFCLYVPLTEHGALAQKPFASRFVAALQSPRSLAELYEHRELGRSLLPQESLRARFTDRLAAPALQSRCQAVIAALRDHPRVPKEERLTGAEVWKAGDALLPAGVESALDALRGQVHRHGIGLLTLEECLHSSLHHREEWRPRAAFVDTENLLAQLCEARRLGATLEPLTQLEDVHYSRLIARSLVRSAPVRPPQTAMVRSPTSVPAGKGRSFSEWLLPARDAEGADSGYVVVLGFSQDRRTPEETPSLLRSIRRFSEALGEILSELAVPDEARGRPLRDRLCGAHWSDELRGFVLDVLVSHPGLRRRVFASARREDRVFWVTLTRLLMRKWPRLYAGPERGGAGLGERLEAEAAQEAARAGTPARRLVDAYDHICSVTHPDYVAVWRVAGPRLILRSRSDHSAGIEIASVGNVEPIERVMFSTRVLARIKTVVERVRELQREDRAASRRESLFEARYDPATCLLSRVTEAGDSEPLCCLQLPFALARRFDLTVTARDFWVDVDLHTEGALDQPAIAATLHFEEAPVAMPVALVRGSNLDVGESDLLSPEIVRLSGDPQHPPARLMQAGVAAALVRGGRAVEINLDAAWVLGGAFRRSYIETFNQVAPGALAAALEREGAPLTGDARAVFAWYAAQLSNTLRGTTSTGQAAILRLADALLRPEGDWAREDPPNRLTHLSKVRGLRAVLSDALVHAFRMDQRVFVLTAYSPHRPRGARGPLHRELPGDLKTYWSSGPGREFAALLAALLPAHGSGTEVFHPPAAGETVHWSRDICELVLQLVPAMESRDIPSTTEIPAPPPLLGPIDRRPQLMPLLQLAGVMKARLAVERWTELLQRTAAHRHAGRRMMKWTKYLADNPTTPAPLAERLTRILVEREIVLAPRVRER